MAQKRQKAKKGSGIFLFELRSPAWPDYQPALGKHLELQPNPSAAPGFLLIGCEVQRVRVVAGQALVEKYLHLFWGLRGDAERVTALRLGFVERQVGAVDQACP